MHKDHAIDVSSFQGVLIRESSSVVPPGSLSQTCH